MKTACILAATLAATVLAQEPPTVGNVWQRVSPAEANMDASKLDEALSYADGRGGSETWCVSVHRDGKLVADKYWDKTGPSGDSEAGSEVDEFTPLVVWSTSKAVTATVVGIAEMAGLLNTDDRASDYIEEWKGSESEEVLVDMLMRHDSGRYYDGVTDFVLSQLQDSQTDFAVNMPITPLCPLRNCPQQHVPGSKYQYNQMGIQNLHRVLQTATGEADVNKYATDQLFTKLSMESRAYYQERSVASPYLDALPSENTDPLLYGGIHMSCKDLARFGQLWLNRGQWNGTEIFTDDFYEKALSGAPNGRAGRSYHWGGGPNHRAGGMGGQFVSFNPEKNVVITRIGGAIGATWNAGQFVNMVMDSLLDGPGSYTREADEIANKMPAEEGQWAEVLRSGDFSGAV